jgi:phosphoribosylanthranilate isomerase
LNDESAVVPVRVKVCGLTSVEDALACVEAGADWIGLNFHPASPRKVDPALAAEIVAALPKMSTAVGVFVDMPPAAVVQTAEHVGLSIVQLHGDEPVEDLARLSGLTIVRAFRLGDFEALDRMRGYLGRAAQLGRAPDAVLVDGCAQGLPGGTGRTIEDAVLDQLALPMPLILAGGLTPENVAERIARVRPWMVDVASGVESSPGRKDPARVRAFVRAARG